MTSDLNIGWCQFFFVMDKPSYLKTIKGVSDWQVSANKMPGVNYNVLRWTKYSSTRIYGNLQLQTTA